MKKNKIGFLDIIAHLILLVISISILYPLLHVVAVSLSEQAYIMAKKVTFFPRGFSFDAYIDVVKSGKIVRAFGNSVYYTIVGVAVNVLMTSLVAYPLSKGYLVGRKLYMKLIIFTMYFSGGMIPFFLLVKSLGLLNSVWALALPNAIGTVNLIIMINFYQSIPQSLYEAAYLDGASEFLILRKIAIPLSKASIASISLFYFMDHWNSYYAPMLYFFDEDKFPMQLILREMLMAASQINLQSSSEFVDGTKLTPEGIKSATMVVSMIPVLIVYPFVQKYFVKGVMIGSVKE